MNGGDERACSPVSTGELQRRWDAARGVAVAADLDAIVVQGANNVTGGGAYLRWLTGASAFSGQPQVAIFPKEGLMTAVTHGPAGGEWELDGTQKGMPGVGRRVSTPSFPTVGYTGRYDGEILAKELKGAGYRRVGLVGQNSMYYGPIVGMKGLCSEIEFVDATDYFDHLTAIKSDEEIAFIRAAGAMQDEVFEKVREFIEPGMRDFEVMAYAQYVGQLLGSETGYYLGCSAAPDAPLAHRTRPDQGRRIREGDIFLWQAETTGPAGYFVHIARLFSFGPTPPALAELYQALVEAQDYTVSLLKPGASSAEIFNDYNTYMEARGLQKETRLHCHGQGYPSVERPLVRYDETMPIAADMNIGIHPSFTSSSSFVTTCDNFLVLKDGTVERIHKTPRKIYEK